MPQGSDNSDNLDNSDDSDNRDNQDDQDNQDYSANSVNSVYEEDVICIEEGNSEDMCKIGEIDGVGDGNGVGGGDSDSDNEEFTWVEGDQDESNKKISMVSKKWSLHAVIGMYCHSGLNPAGTNRDSFVFQQSSISMLCFKFSLMTWRVYSRVE